LGGIYAERRHSPSDTLEIQSALFPAISISVEQNQSVNQSRANFAEVPFRIVSSMRDSTKCKVRLTPESLFS